MSNFMEHIAFKQTLIQSEYAADVYNDIFEQESTTFANPLVEEVEEIYNQIINRYDDLTDEQVNVVGKIINELNQIKVQIDPKRLKSFKHLINEDSELVLYRENSFGLINILIHTDGEFVFSFIGNLEGNILEFHTDENCDYEGLVLKFLS